MNEQNSMTDNNATPSDAMVRLRGFAMHLGVYFVVAIILVIINVMMAPGDWWSAFPIVLWGAPLALHTAYVMGFFKGSRKDQV